MRIFFFVISVFSAVVLSDATEAGQLSASGPNPNWTKMQKFEWYLGYMSRAAQVCGAYEASSVLNRLARMTPYGGVGLSTVTGDGFAGPVCGGINNDAKELAADAEKIEKYLEATYNCSDEACFGQTLRDWTFHDCADVLRAHLSERDIGEEDLSAVTFTSVRHSGATLDYTARVRLKSCQGSFYVDLNDSCRVTKEYTRGDCEVAGVDAF